MGTPEICVLKKWRMASPVLFDEVISLMPIMKGSGILAEMESVMGVDKTNRGSAADVELKDMLDLS